MAPRLKDKVCIITGTGDGMGRAAALLFCAEGAKVVGCDINAQRAKLTLETQKARVRADACRCILGSDQQADMRRRSLRSCAQELRRH